ncbi:hypothetical protein ACFW16_04720 [Inquilinus sp. NPDC058860]|uniref:hypothetical protein n=1 Tax=Inquilinus sp. NPDC058860 TaxID=3346652 RepID=UPI0036980EC7
MSSDNLAEVWGDVVDLRHLRLAVLIGAALSLAAYFGAVEAFKALGGDASVNKAYAMLVGLGGCVASCAICARLFPPKRILLEAGSDADARERAIAALIGDSDDRNAPIPAATSEELEALGLDGLKPVAGGRASGPAIHAEPSRRPMQEA